MTVLSGAGLMIVLVRHGQTVWNAEARYQGHRDIPLSDTGLRQAAALGATMAGWGISAVYSSDLSRAYETARRIAAPHEMCVSRDGRLREMSFGVWESLTQSEIESSWRDMYREWLERPTRVRPPGGETLVEVRDRAMRALREIVGRSLHLNEDLNDGGRAGGPPHVVVVFHGGPIRAVLATMLGLPLDDGFHRLVARPGSYAMLSGGREAWRRFVQAGDGAGSVDIAGADAIRAECIDVVPAGPAT